MGFVCPPCGHEEQIIMNWQQHNRLPQKKNVADAKQKMAVDKGNATCSSSV